MKRTSRFLLSLILVTQSLAIDAAEMLKVAHDQWIGYAGVFVAKSKKYFEDEGLNIETVSFSGPGDTLPPLIGGHVDIALTTLQNLAMMSSKNVTGIKAVYFLDTSDGADAVVAAKNIKTPADLKGKKIAVTRNEVNHMLLIAALDSAGLTEKDITIVDMSADDGGAAFLAGKVDAAVTWEPWVTQAKSGGGNIVFTSADVPNLIMDTISVMPETLKKKGPALKAFMRAVDKGVAYLKSNPTESKAIIAKWLDVSPEEVTGMLEGDRIYGLKDNETLMGTEKKPGPGYDSMSKNIDFLVKRKLINKPIEAGSLIAPGLIR